MQSIFRRTAVRLSRGSISSLPSSLAIRSNPLLRRDYHGLGSPHFNSERPTQVTSVQWLEGFNFIGKDSDGKSVPISGGEGLGVSPMTMLLMALGGCAAVDVVNIAFKQKQVLKDLSIQVEGQRSKEGARPYEIIHMKWIAKGTGLNKEKLEQAVKLSTEKYCGVHATMSAVPNITFEVVIANS